MTDDRQNNQDWKDYEELIERYIQVIAKNMNLYGITPSVGRLYGTLYFAEEPMTLDQMRDALLMSKTSMSTGVKALADMKMVTPTFRKGIRKDLYQTEKDWYKSLHHYSLQSGADKRKIISKKQKKRCGNWKSSKRKRRTQH